MLTIQVLADKDSFALRGWIRLKRLRESLANVARLVC